jgi:hypothetical protein
MPARLLSPAAQFLYTPTPAGPACQEGRFAVSTRFVSLVLVILVVGISPGCAETQGAPGASETALDAPAHQAADGELDQAAAEAALAPETAVTSMTFPSDSPALLGHVSAAADLESSHFRLRLSVGAPVARAHRTSPSYQIHFAPPWPPAAQETP